MIAVARGGNNNLTPYNHTNSPVKDRFRDWDRVAGFPSTMHSMQDPFRPGREGREVIYFFSITHCRGCWCLRAKSITWVTLVSAIS